MKASNRILLAILLSAVLSGCGSTRVFMVGRRRPAIAPESVRIYQYPPRHFERIAIINASSAGAWPVTLHGQTNQAIEKIKEEAANLGANGVLIEAVGTTSS